MKQEFKIRKEHIILILVSIAALGLRIFFRDESNMDLTICLLPWYDEMSALGFKEALTTQVGDYNFLYQLFIFILTRFPGQAIYKYKILSVIFDYVLASGVYAFIKKLSGEKKALIGYAVTLFLPTVFINSAVWAQCDAMYVSMIVWSLYFLYTGKTNRSFIFLGLALALKLQTVFILPFYGFVFLRGVIDKDKKIRLYHFAISVGTVLVTALPNILAGRPVTDLIKNYTSQTDSYQVISKNYQSIWNLFHLEYSSDAKWCIGFTFLMLIVLMVFFYIKKADVTGKHFIWCTFILSYTCVMFLPSMHERYSFLYEILVLILAFTNSLGWIATVLLQLISVKTYIYFLNGTALNMNFLSVVNFIIYIFMIYVFYKELTGSALKADLFELSEDRDESVHSFAKKDGSGITRRDIIAILLLTGIFLVIGSFHLGRAKAPETYEEFGTETAHGTEVYISLAQTQFVQSVCIYPLMNGSESFQLFYADNGAWSKIDEELAFKGVFTWRRVDVNVRTHQFCIVFANPDIQVGEIICLDASGKVIELLDAPDYPGIFDEQDTISSVPTSFDSMIFDEVYHGRTAYEFLHGLNIYEDTHPPLGKILISIGIKLFGMNPFGYRIIVLIFGMLCVPVMYLLALEVTGDSRYAYLAGVLQVTEFMHYSLSRIATIDIIVAFFVLCMFYGCFGFIKHEKKGYLVFSGVSFAFGIATKWTAMYAAAGIALILFIWMVSRIRAKEKNAEIVKFVLVCVGSFIIFPAFIYVISYVPFVRVYPDKNLLQHAISNSTHMLDYHKNVTASHPYQSSWYSWLFDWIPLADSRVKNGDLKGVISTFVNPFVCYVGLASVFHHIYMTVRKKDITSALLVVFYMSMLLPWVFITRTVFIYQYFICTKILIIMICRSVQCIGFKKETGVLKFVGGLSTALFIAYFPVISGVMVNKDYIDKILTLLPKWWF